MIKVLTMYAWAMIGTPYKLGGNATNQGGIDCSGFVLELLRSGGLWGLQDVTAQGLHDSLKNNSKWNTQSLSLKPSEGSILFFGKSTKEITHVQYCAGDYIIEAGGTDNNGMVRPRPIHWRSDLVAILTLKSKDDV